MWRASRSDVPRALPQQIGMPRLPFGMISGTKPEQLKIAKTRQRARSYAGKDPGGDVEAAGSRLQHREGVLLGRATNGCPPPPQSTIDLADVEKLKKSNKSLTKQVKMIMRLFKSDEKFSHMLDQFESSPEFGGASGSGGCEDDEPGNDEDDDEDEEDGDS
ncbi:hypothetical protein Tco_1480323 [Tanacetum coccineum]